VRLQDILPMLEGVRGGPEQYSAKCPAHDDNKQSLSLSQDGDKVVLTCHAGCAAQDVVGALGLSMADLFSEPLKPAPSKAPARVVATYDSPMRAGSCWPER